MKCHYCKSEASTIDHKIPKSKGGSDDESNKVPSCLKCNVLKSSENYEVFKKIFDGNFEDCDRPRRIFAFRRIKKIATEMELYRQMYGIELTDLKIVEPSLLAGNYIKKIVGSPVNENS